MIERLLPQAGFFIGAIVVFLALGMALLVREFLKARRNSAALGTLRKNVEAARAGATRTPEDLEKVLLEGLPEDSPAWRRVDQLLEQRTDSARAPQAQSLADAELSRVQRGLALPRTIAAVLVLLGLCGAVGGLLKAVPGMVRVLTEQTTMFERGLELKAKEDQLAARERATASTPALKAERAALEAEKQEYAESRKAALQGLTTLADDLTPAFVASLSGILATVFLTLVLWGAETAQERWVLTPLEEVTATHLVPLLTPPDDVGSLKQAVDILTSSQEYFSQLTNRLLGQFDQVAAQLGVLYTVVDQFRHAAGALNADRQALSEAHESLLQSVRRFSELAEEVQRGTGAMESRHGSLLAAMQALVAPVEALGDELRAGRDHNAQTLQAVVNQLRQSLEVHLDRLGSALAEAAQDRVAAQEKRVVTALDAVRAAVEKQAASLDAVGKVSLAQDQLLEGVRQAADRQVAAAEGTRSAMEAVLQQARDDAKSAGQLRDRLAGIAQSLPNASAAAMEPVVAAVQDVAQTLRSQNGHTDLAPVVVQLQEVSRLLAAPRPGTPQADSQLLPLVQEMSARLQALEQAQSAAAAGSDRWTRAALLFVPATAVAAGALLSVALPPLTLAVAGGLAVAATGLVAWWMRR